MTYTPAQIEAWAAVRGHQKDLWAILMRQHRDSEIRRERQDYEEMLFILGGPN